MMKLYGTKLFKQESDHFYISFAAIYILRHKKKQILDNELEHSVV
jgi:hypothetical protein